MAQIRQEINILNRTITSTTDDIELVQLDTSQYNGTITYYFEILANNTAIGNSTVSLRRSGTTTDDASITVNGESPYTLLRSSSFTPPAGATSYMVHINNANTNVKAARIIIIQSATSITRTETQIELCGTGGSTTTSTTAVAVANPKYWKYTAANWDGIKTFYFESTDAAGNTKSGATVVLQTSSSITAPSWSNVASSSHTNTSLSPTRTRSAAITLVDGNWYRVAYSTGTSKSAATIYNAKVVVNQNRVVDSYHTTLTSGGYRIEGGTAGSGETTQSVGQSFTTSSAYNITAVWFYMSKTGSPTDNITVELLSTSMTGTVLATSNAVDASTLGSGASGLERYIEFTFPSPVSLSSSTKYYLRLTRSGARDSSNYASSVYATTGFSNGGAFVRDNNSWSSESATDDLLFNTRDDGSITKLEPQYLLANTLFAAGTGLQTFPTKWDSTEWSGVTNSYYLQVEAANDSTSDVELWEADGGGSAIGTVTNIDNAQISSAMTMPTSQNLDVKATTNAGDVAGARILVATVINTASAALTGTVTSSITEADIVTGGKTIILTLTGDTWVAAGTGPIGSTANTQALIDGIDSAQSEGTGWDAVVKPGIETTDVVRTSDTVATITLDAEATYNITANETITATIPAAVLTGGAQIVASPTFTITATSSSAVRDFISMGILPFSR